METPDIRSFAKVGDKGTGFAHFWELQSRLLEGLLSEPQPSNFPACNVIRQHEELKPLLSIGEDTPAHAELYVGEPRCLPNVRRSEMD